MQKAAAGFVDLCVLVDLLTRPGIPRTAIFSNCYEERLSSGGHADNLCFGMVKRAGNKDDIRIQHQDSLGPLAPIDHDGSLTRSHILTSSASDPARIFSITWRR
jgi:hypothetical protein